MQKMAADFARENNVNLEIALLIAKPATDRSLDLGARGGADHLVEDLTVSEEEQCRNALDAQARREPGIFVHV
jgi:hypothetical protein